MPGCGTLIAICQWGGSFTTSDDGTLVYSGGDAHALSIDRRTKFEELKVELSEMWKFYDSETKLSIKYFLPNNRKTLITLSSDKDIERMVDFHEESSTVDVFVVTKEISMAIIPFSTSTAQKELPSGDASLVVPNARTGRKLVVEPVTPVNVTPGNIISSDIEGGDEGPQKLRRLWANSLTGLHQQFNNVEAVRDAIRKYSVAHGFSYMFKNNDGTRVSARCKVEGCTWRIYVSRLSTTPLFRTKKFVDLHTCGVGSSLGSGRPHASRKLVASIMKEKLRDSPNFRPKEIADQIQREFGIELRYSQAWRGMETAKEELHGSYKEAYNHLPWLCEKIMETNPGSVVSLVTSSDQTFQRLFVAMHASISGFQNGCRPLIFLDTVTVKSKYQSELLTATSIDGNDGIFPVSFALVDAVTDDNWHWFLSEFKSAIAPTQPLTFVASRQLRQCIMLLFEDACHSYCLGHLAEELKDNLMTGPISQEVYDAIVGHLKEAACAANEEGFKKFMGHIQNISPEAHEWILQSEPENWANSLLKGSRCNHLESSLAAPFYEWVGEIPMLPVTQIIDTIRQKMMETIYIRKVESEQWSTRLTPSLEEKLQKMIVKAQSLQVLFSPTPAVEVRDFLGVNYFVYVDSWDCSCREWQLSGFPCSHGISALQQLGRDIYDYCSRYYTTEAFRSAYSHPINPVPTTDKPLNGDSQVHVYPPLCRLTGPPKKRRDRSKGKVKRPLHCSKCKRAGHNRATCHAYS